MNEKVYLVMNPDFDEFYIVELPSFDSELEMAFRNVFPDTSISGIVKGELLDGVGIFGIDDFVQRLSYYLSNPNRKEQTELLIEMLLKLKMVV